MTRILGGLLLGAGWIMFSMADKDSFREGRLLIQLMIVGLFLIAVGKK